MGETPQFLNLLLTMELQELLKKRYPLINQDYTQYKTITKNILLEIAWNRILKNDLEMAEYIATMIEKPIVQIVQEIGLKWMIINSNAEKIDKVLETLEIDKSTIDNQALIKLAANAITGGYAFSQLKGFFHLVFQEPYNQELLNEISELSNRNGLSRDWIQKEMPKLIDFIKESVFTDPQARD